MPMQSTVSVVYSERRVDYIYEMPLENKMTLHKDDKHRLLMKMGSLVVYVEYLMQPLSYL